jgi:hypothetical protein
MAMLFSCVFFVTKVTQCWQNVWRQICCNFMKWPKCFYLIQINHQPDATIFQFIFWHLFTAQHVSGVFPPIIRSSMTAVAASGFTFVSWWESCCVCGWAGLPARPRTQHSIHHDTRVKPEAAIAVIELLMMGGKTPETCWAVNKCQKETGKFLHLVGDLFELYNDVQTYKP